MWGGSFGCELALAYAERYPARVSELVLWGITTGRRSEADWLFRGGVGVMFPEQWYRFADAAGDDDPVAGYRRLLHDPDPAVHRKAAEDWCAWESVTPDWPPANGIAERFRDPVFALGFARLVTHYVHHDLWIEDGSLIRDAGRLAGVPVMLIHGRFDLQAPLASAWDLQLALPDATLDVVERRRPCCERHGDARPADRRHRSVRRCLSRPVSRRPRAAAWQTGRPCACSAAIASGRS